MGQSILDRLVCKIVVKEFCDPIKGGFRMDDVSSIDSTIGGERPEAEVSDHTKVVIAPLESPEEVGVAGTVGVDNRPICDNNFIIENVVDGQTLPVAQEGKTSPNSKAETDIFVSSDNGNQILWIRCIVNCTQAVPGTDANVALLMVDFNRIEMICSKKNSTINISRPRNGTMTATSDGPLALEVGEKLDCLSDLFRRVWEEDTGRSEILGGCYYP